MKKIFTLCALAAFLFSCQKEVSNENGGGGPGNDSTSTSGNKLYRQGIKSGSDSLTVDYTYNSNARITNYKMTGTQNGSSYVANLAITRNSWNIITQSTLTSPDLTSAGIDKLVINHQYDDVAATYKYSVWKISYPGLGDYADSTVYTYDASKRLVTAIEYVNDGSGYEPDNKEEYTYSGNNVATVKYSSYDATTSAYTLDGTQTYEYDSKTNPLLFTTDAVPLKMVSNLATFFSSNNITKVTTADSTGSSSESISYTYNSNNRPVKATTTSGTTTTTIRYYYQ
jgi:hypothetical protein